MVRWTEKSCSSWLKKKLRNPGHGIFLKATIDEKTAFTKNRQKGKPFLPGELFVILQILTLLL